MPLIASTPLSKALISLGWIAFMTTIVKNIGAASNTYRKTSWLMMYPSKPWMNSTPDNRTHEDQDAADVERHEMPGIRCRARLWCRRRADAAVEEHAGHGKPPKKTICTKRPATTIFVPMSRVLRFWLDIQTGPAGLKQEADDVAADKRPGDPASRHWKVLLPLHDIRDLAQFHVDRRSEQSRRDQRGRQPAQCTAPR